MYADDIKIYGMYDCSNSDEAQRFLKTSLERMLSWSSIWNLPINLGKSAVMRKMPMLIMKFVKQN